MPYQNEHACRLRDPGDFDPQSFRRMTRTHEDVDYSVIMGRLQSNNNWADQAFRYPKDAWSLKAAQGHCRSHSGIKFEAALDSEGEGKVCHDCGGSDEGPTLELQDMPVPQEKSEFPEREEEIPQDFSSSAEDIDLVVKELDTLTQNLDMMDIKAGRVLSTSTRDALARVVDGLAAISTELQTFLETADSMRADFTESTTMPNEGGSDGDSGGMSDTDPSVSEESGTEEGVMAEALQVLNETHQRLVDAINTEGG